MVYTGRNGFYQWISGNYGYHTTHLLKSWVNLRKRICNVRQQLIFLVRCRKFDILPPHINNLKIHLQLYSNSVNKIFCKKLMSFKFNILCYEIRDMNFNLNFLLKSVHSIEQGLIERLPSDLINRFYEFNNLKISKFNYNKRKCLIKKFNYLLLKRNITCNPLANINKSKWLVNISNKKIPDDVIDILSLGENFSLPLVNSDNKDRVTSMLETVKNIEVNYKKIPTSMIETTRNNISNSIKKFLCNKRHINYIDRFLINGYSKCQRFLRNNKDLLVTKADKGQITVIMNKNDYVNKMQTALNDVTTYKIVKKDPVKRISSKIHDMIRAWLDNGLIDDVTYKRLNCTNANLPRCYGLPKIHKENAPLRIIVSSLGSPAYNVAFFIHKILIDSIQKPKSYVKDGWTFANMINNTTIESDDVLISLDVSALFGNIPKQLVIKAIENRWTDIEKNTTFNYNQFIFAIETILDSTSFSFNGVFFEQIFGCPMGSPLSPILADIVMDDLETSCLERLDFKVRRYFRYVDDIFAVIPRDKINKILNIFNNYHERLKFTFEVESMNRISFLNTTIIRRGNLLLTDWYHKPTFSGRYMNYFSGHPLKYKINTITNLVDQAILLSNDQFHNKNLHIVKQILINNCFPLEVVDRVIKKRLMVLKHRNNCNSSQGNNELPNNFDKKSCIALPYIKGLSEDISNSLSKVGLKSVYSIPKKLNTLIKRGKDIIPKLNKTEIVYQINCKNCQFSYIGQTKRHLITRIKEHKNNIKMHVSNYSVISKHRVDFNHDFDWDNPTILHNEKHTRKRELAEMFYIKKVNNTLNAQKDTENLNIIYDKVIRLL